MKTDDSSMRFSLRRQQDGAVLVVVLLAMIGLLGMGLAGLYLTSGNIQMSSNINMRNQALYVAEAGIQTAKTILNRNTPGSPYWQPDLLSHMLAGKSPSGVSVSLPSPYTDEIPGTIGDSTDPAACLGKTSNGVSTRGAYLRDESPLPTDPPGLGCQTDPDPSQPLSSVYINCYYPPKYSSNSVAYNEAPPDPNTMSPTPTQYMGRYTLFIRQDLGECRQKFFTTDYNGIAVVRSEGIAADNRTKVVLEVTMSANPNTQILSQGLATVCPAGAAGCDDNSSVQQGITVGPANPGSGGASGTGGSTGSPWTPCTSNPDCASGTFCCDGTCMDTQDYNTHCGGCGASGDNGSPCTGGHCCNGKCCSSDNTCCDIPPGGLQCHPTAGNQNLPTSCGLCGTNCQAQGPTTTCCLISGTTMHTCTDTNTDNSNCGACGNTCGGSTPTCCNGTCVNTSADKNNCGKCSNACSNGTCCAGACCASPNICCNYGSASGCQPNPGCPRIATIGIPGPWDADTSNVGSNCDGQKVYSSDDLWAGSAGFRAWLIAHSAACLDPSLTIFDPANPNDPNNLLTADRLAPYQVIILLDVVHTPADWAQFLNNKRTGYYYGANDSQKYAALIKADKCGDPNRAQMRPLQPSEAQALGNWVRGGGGLMTNVGVECLGTEIMFANSVLQSATNGTVSYFDDSSYRHCVGQKWQLKGDWTNGMPAPPAGFRRDYSIARAITYGVSPPQSVVDFMWVDGMFVVKTSLSDSNGPPGFASYARVLDVNGAANGDTNADCVTSGTTTSCSHLVGFAGEFGQGRLNVWGDEWLAYDAVWNVPNVSNSDAGSNNGSAYWTNLITWLGNCN